MSSSFPNPLSEKEEQYYVKLLEKNDDNARAVLIERNLRLVAHIAKKYVGLIKAVNTYSGKKSTRLATYAAKCIENEILMSIRASKRVKQEISLSLPIGVDKDGNEISLNDILGTDPDEIIDAISIKIQVGQLYDAIKDALTERERTVVMWRYGLAGKEPLPQREIAKALGISRSYVSRIEKKALEKLKDFLKESQPQP